ncbi:MAG: hypothetical protein GX808_05285 [Syntrophomonadaceae bacterium]|nr:hypothetical protein [Syntrophomonadaceae bacterium]
MANRERIRYVFTSSNTIQGFYTFIPQLIAGIKRIFILKGAIGSGKAAFLRQFGQDMLKRGFRAEFWISSFDPLNPEGVFIPEMDTAVIIGDLPGVTFDDEMLAAEIIEVDKYENQEAITAKSADIVQLTERMQNSRETAYHILKTAGLAAGEIKKVNAAYINQVKLAELTVHLTEQILEQGSEEKHYFASAVTPEGMINYIDTISSFCRQRYLFTGPFGTGKSSIIKKIAGQAKSKGLSLEYYHNGFDVNSLTAVVITDLQVALVDAGYLAVNIKPGDEIIDMESLLDHYDHNQADQQISAAKRQYETLVQEAQKHLENAWMAAEELKRIHLGAIDFDELDKRRGQIIENIISSSNK